MWHFREFFHLAEPLQKEEVSLQDPEGLMRLSQPNLPEVPSQEPGRMSPCCTATVTWFVWDVGQSGKNVNCVFSCHVEHDCFFHAVLIHGEDLPWDHKDE